MSSSARSRRSIETMRASRSVNQGSMPVRRASSWGLASRRRCAKSAQSRSSVAPSGGSSPPSSGARFQEGCSHSSERPETSSERSAFWSAASKVRSAAITSPVAFICVPRLRSPAGNLSKGQRGIFTTQ